MEESLGAEQDQPYLAHQAELERQQTITGGLQGEVGGTLDLLDSLSSQYQEVSRRTTSLHEACQHLLEEQQQLAQLDKELQERLSVFQVKPFREENTLSALGMLWRFERKCTLQLKF